MILLYQAASNITADIFSYILFQALEYLCLSPRTSSLFDQLPNKTFLFPVDELKQNVHIHRIASHTSEKNSVSFCNLTRSLLLYSSIMLFYSDVLLNLLLGLL